MDTLMQSPHTSFLSQSGVRKKKKRGVNLEGQTDDTR